MLKILAMNKEQLLALEPENIAWLLSTEEVVYMAKTLDAFWAYDYEAAEKGKFGFHALLKSLRHSDGFFVSKIMLQYANIRKIMADQMAMRIERFISRNPDWVAGIPDGATELGKDLAQVMGAKLGKMEKNDGKIVFLT